MSHRGTIFMVLVLSFCPAFHARAQEVPPQSMPEPLADFAQLLQFNTPTRIEGRLLTFDTYDDAIWVELTHWFQDGGWVVVKNEAHLLLYPRDADMMRWFRAMKTGTPIRMTVRKDEHGKRRVIELDGT